MFKDEYEGFGPISPQDIDCDEITNEEEWA